MLVPPTLPAEDWRDRANCRGTDVNLFFSKNHREPLEVCATCPVWELCRRQARAGREYGIWGGETQEDRIVAGCGPPMMSRSAARARRKQQQRWREDIERQEREQ